MNSSEALRVGVLMNCRGVTELVVASIGWQHQLINGLGPTILTLVALVTTAATGPSLHYVAPPPQRAEHEHAASGDHDGAR
jgi:Kef-type K+ transport system membrane component KefB